jgi:hypothetical protein
MEPENEPRPSHYQLAIHAQKSTPEVRLQQKQIHTVRDLGRDEMQLSAGEPVKLHGPSAGFSTSAQNHNSPFQGLRTELHVRWPEWCTVSFYAALVALAIPFHEPWADEAQAWQLARCLSLPALFKTYIRYEGSPGLWYFLLWILNRAHIGYTGLHWICGVIALAAASLLVFASPLPRYLKLTLPFTYFLMFQYAVIARNYVLVPILLFIVAYCWKKSPLVVALVLGLLANTALHAAVISGGLAVVYGVEHLRNGSLNSSIHRRKLLLGALIVIAFYAFAIWTAWPPHDLALSRVRGESSSLLAHAVGSLVFSICEPWGLSIPFWIIIAAWFVARRKLLFLLPVLFFALFSAEVHFSWWHLGLLLPLMVCLLWITWPAPGTVPSRYENIGRFAMIFMIATHLLWSGYALVYDHYNRYSPDRAAAEFLKPFVQNGDKIAVTYIVNQGDTALGFSGVGILPYFDHNIYINQANSFWWWSDLDSTEDRFNEVLPTHPQLVLVEVRYKHPVDWIDLNRPRFKSVQKAGFRFSKAYCGTHPERLDLGLTICHVIFQYADGIPSTVDSQTYVPVSR